VSLLRRAVTGFLALKLLTLTINLVTFPVLRRPAGRRSRSVALLVPMRNEEHRLAETLPGILAQEVDELVLLDDCSTDATPELARGLASGSLARVESGEPTPSGWAGKTWACHQLADRAASDVLVFCDADVALAPGAVDAVLAELERQDADLLSVFPRQRTGSLGEHLLVPLVDDVLLCFLPFPLLGLDVPSAATANGSVMAFTRSSYERLGGFGAVRGEVVEDVAMARHVRRRGLRLGLVLGGDLVGTRMYTGYAHSVDGLGRGLLPVVGSRLALVAGEAWHLAAYTLPALAVWHRPGWALPLALGAAERLAVEAKTGRRRWHQALLPPLSPVAALPVLARALRRSQEWKGRSYASAGVPR
jgi:hypothetical protein